MQRCLSRILIVALVITGQIGQCPVYAEQLSLPAAGVRVSLSPAYNPPVLKGIKVHPDNPFKFEFILDQGDDNTVIPAKAGILKQEQLKLESTKLIKYFLASITTPEQDLWVNLSPYEKDRIVPTSFGQTEMGRDLLAQDYLLKQITASLMYPEDEIGKKFWKRIYDEAAKKYGTTNIPVSTFNKVWIIPEKAVVYENAKAGTAYVVESKLKVMLESDYLAITKNKANANNIVTPTGPVPAAPYQSSELEKLAPPVDRAPAYGPPVENTNQMGEAIIREVIIPELTKEINEGKNFAQLRQVYSSLILATWYKKKIKDSILARVYTDKNKVAGVAIDDPDEKQNIYEQYLKAFKTGAVNLIKEEQDPLTHQVIPRKYFSGGMRISPTVIASTDLNMAMASVPKSAVIVSVDAAMNIASFPNEDAFMKKYSFIPYDIEQEIPVAVQAVKILLNLRRSHDKPIIIWQNMSLGEMYPFFLPRLKRALEIFEPENGQEDVMAWIADPTKKPKEMLKAKFILLKLKKPSTWSYINRTLPNGQLPEQAVAQIAEQMGAQVIMIDSSKRDLSRAQLEVKAHVNQDWIFLNPTMEVPGHVMSRFDVQEFFLRDGPAKDIRVLINGKERSASDVAREIYGNQIIRSIEQSDDPALDELKKQLEIRDSAQLAHDQAMADSSPKSNRASGDMNMIRQWGIDNKNTRVPKRLEDIARENGGVATSTARKVAFENKIQTMGSGRKSSGKIEELTQWAKDHKGLQTEETLKVIGKRYGVSVFKTWQVLTEYGITTRGQGGVQSEVTTQLIEYIKGKLKLGEEIESVEQLMAKFKVGLSTVYKAKKIASQQIGNNAQLSQPRTVEQWKGYINQFVQQPWYIDAHVGLYHNVAHSTYAAIAAAYYGMAQGFDEEKIELLVHAALFHDFEIRASGTMAHVPATLAHFDQDWNREISFKGEAGKSVLREEFGWTDLDFVMAKALVARSEFPLADKHSNKFYAKNDTSPIKQYTDLLRQINQLDSSGESVTFVMEQGYAFSMIDILEGYIRKNPEQADQMVRNLAQEGEREDPPSPLKAEQLLKGTYGFLTNFLGKTEVDIAIKKTLEAEGVIIGDILLPPRDEMLRLFPRDNQAKFEENLSYFKERSGVITQPASKAMNSMPQRDNYIKLKKQLGNIRGRNQLKNFRGQVEKADLTNRGRDALLSMIDTRLKDSLFPGWERGGIDLTSATMNVDVMAGSPTEVFGDDTLNIDPAMLKQLENAPGFTPIITAIEPLGDIRLFLLQNN